MFDVSPEGWRIAAETLKSKVAELEESLGHYVSALEKLNDLRELVRGYRQKLKQDQPRFRYYSFGTIYDALTFTTLDKITIREVLVVKKAIDIATKDVVVPDDYTELRDLLAESFETFPQTSR